MNRVWAILLGATLVAACGGRELHADPALRPVENAVKLPLHRFSFPETCWDISGTAPDGLGVSESLAELEVYCVANRTDISYPMPQIDFATEVGLHNKGRRSHQQVYHRFHDAWQTATETIVRLRAHLFVDDCPRCLDLTSVHETAKIPRTQTPIRFVKLPWR